MHELGFAECQKTDVFRGRKEFSTAQINSQLFGGRSSGFQGGGPGTRGEMNGQHPGSNGQPNQPSQKFLAPLSECEFTLSAILEGLQRDSFPALPECRPARCTGTAIACAATLLAATCPSAPARALLFVGGPATDGGGAVVGKDLEQAMRSHKDIVKVRIGPFTKSRRLFAYTRLTLSFLSCQDAAPFMRKAVKFYEGVCTQVRIVFPKS